MRVLIDARPALGARMTGVGHYTRELIHRLPEVDPGTTYLAWYLHARRALSPRRWRSTFPPHPNLVERWSPFPGRVFERVSRWNVPRVEWMTRFDVLFAPNYLPPPTRSRRVVLTVHDLAFRLYPETAPITGRWLRRLGDALRKAAEVITVSHATRADLLELYPVDPDRVTAIHHGVDPERFHPPGPEEVRRVRRRFGIDGPYLLFVGGLEPRKNLDAVLRAFAQLPADLDPTLVIAGAAVPWYPRGRVALADAVSALPPRIRRRVVITEYVGDPDRGPLYGGAEALVFPSLYEGFGLPVLEAMACGTPVLTSGVSALPEVAGDAAVLVDPRDQGAIAEGMRRLLQDESLRRRLRSSGPARAARFRWEETARRTADVLHRAAGR
jgi:glycosyltransferase involved in cell wall biosynthesis